MSKYQSTFALLITIFLATAFIQPALQKKCFINLGSVNSGPSESNERIYCGPVPAVGPFAPCTLELNPVCGYKSGSSEGIDAGNPCDACVINAVEYYYPGECKEQSDHSQEESEEDRLYKCINIGADPATIMCLAIYDPVCAYRSNDTNNKVTVSNDCTACGLGLYDYYTPGACPGDEEGGLTEGEFGEGESLNNEVGESGEACDWFIRCLNPALAAMDFACTEQYEPVCAYRDDEENGSGTTVGNSCVACTQQGYDYYSQGECVNDSEEGQIEEEEILGGSVGTRCEKPDPSATPGNVFCTQQYDPVCAYLDSDTSMSNGVTVGNACAACSQSGYDFYIKGACEDQI